MTTTTVLYSFQWVTTGRVHADSDSDSDSDAKDYQSKRLLPAPSPHVDLSRSNQIAHWARRQGLGKGDVVALVMPSCTDYGKLP